MSQDGERERPLGFAVARYKQGKCPSCGKKLGNPEALVGCSDASGPEETLGRKVSYYVLPPDRHLEAGRCLLSGPLASA